VGDRKPPVRAPAALEANDPKDAISSLKMRDSTASRLLSLQLTTDN
jgi:hypothetical protein